uniref:Putative Ham1 protein n=1 Tax=unidentified microorganism TaxID=81726 RepID=Q2YI59_9ZZZZ|nr:putative Ham1 protein [unidentified microorganism]
MNKITYVSNNYKKYEHIKELFDENEISLNYFDCSFKKTITKDISSTSKKEAEVAYKVLGNPVIVTKTGFYIEEYPKNPDYPGILLKESGICENIEKLLSDMKGVVNRNCYFINCLTYFDGETMKQFYCSNFGYLLEEAEELNSIYDLFVPTSSSKPLSKLTEEERIRLYDGRVYVQNQFFTWYKKYMKNGNKVYQKTII